MRYLGWSNFRDFEVAKSFVEAILKQIITKEKSLHQYNYRWSIKTFTSLMNTQRVDFACNQTESASEDVNSVWLKVISVKSVWNDQTFKVLMIKWDCEN